MGRLPGRAAELSQAIGPAPGQRRASWLRRVPVLVWLIVALQTGLLFGTTVLYPVFNQPDEVTHVDYVLAHREGDWWSGPGQRFYQSGVIRAFAQTPKTQAHQNLGGVTPAKRSARKSFDALGTAPNTVAQPDQMVQHPPLYYGLAAGLSYLIPHFSHLRYDVQVFWLRLMSVLFFAPVPILTWAMARRLTGSAVAGYLAATIPLAVPSYLRTGSAVTNDSLLTVLGATLLYLLARVLIGDHSKRLAVAIGVVWGAALLTKGLALVLTVVIITAYVVAGVGKPRGDRRGLVRPGLIAVGTGAALGGWWWVRNAIVYHAVQPAGYGPKWGPDRLYGPDRPGGTEKRFLEGFLRLLSKRFFGSLGLVDTPALPVHLMVVMFVVAVVAVVSGVWLGAHRAPAPRWSMAVIVLPTVLLVGLLYTGSRATYLHKVVIPGVQIRYLVPALGGLTLAVAIGLERISGRLARWLPAGVLLAVLIYDSVTTFTVLTVSMSPDVPGLWDRLRGATSFVIGWSPMTKAPTITLLALAAAVALVTLGAFLRLGLTRDLAEPDRSNPIEVPLPG